MILKWRRLQGIEPPLLRLVYWNTFGLVFTTEMHIVGPDHVDVDCVWQAKVKLIMHYG